MKVDVPAELLERARDDAAAVPAMLPIAEVTDAIVGFLAQQAVEKALKTVPAGRGQTYPFSHEFEGLVELCRTSGVDVPGTLESDAGLLTPYAVRHRYAEGLPGLVDRETALSLADLAVGWAAEALGG